jgi:hypothetical protein
MILTMSCEKVLLTGAALREQGGIKREKREG